MDMNQFTKQVSCFAIANKNFNKLFCIGYNKTGTTTLERVLKTYGYKLPIQREQELRLTKTVFETDYTELLRFCDQYDAFQDMPFSQGLTFIVADALFPNSKFILSERDADSWFASISNSHKKLFNLERFDDLTEQDIFDKFLYLYPGYVYSHKKRLLTKFDSNGKEILWNKIHDYEYYIKEYKRRNEDIKRYFSDAPHKLLTIDITKEKDTSKICDFLNIPSRYIIEMPHLNET